MVRPANFGYNAETAENNAFQTKQTEEASNVAKKAQEEFDNFVHILSSKGVRVIVVNDTPQPIKPDAIFPNNWFSTDDKGNIIYYSMFAKNRRLERLSNLPTILQNENLKVNEIKDYTYTEANNLFLEGTGSLILDKPNSKAYACYSLRTDKNVFEKWCANEGFKPIGFTATDQNNQLIYHTNVMMCIGETFAVICLESIKNQEERALVKNELTNSAHEIIEISIEQMNNFAGNMLQVRGKEAQYLVMSEQAYKSLTAMQASTLGKHTEIIRVPIYTIEKYGGGSARCMMAEIYNPTIEAP